MSDHVVDAEGLVKDFGAGKARVRALDDVDLRVAAGSITCLLGHNGSGKTTLVRVLTTLLLPTSGRARVAGADVVADPVRVRRAIAMTGQENTLDTRLSGRENLVVLARLLGFSARDASRRAEHLLEHYDVAAAADRPVSTWSGGMRRRLDLAASLLGSPRLLVLDEPTTGLDPQSRATIWHNVAELRRSGTSVLLTTQYLDEADRVADLAVVLRDGRVVAAQSPTQLKRRIGRRLVVRALGGDLGPARAALGALGIDDLHEADREDAPPEFEGLRLAARVDDPALTLPPVLDALQRGGLDVVDVGLHEPTLDEAYLALMGAPRD